MHSACRNPATPTGGRNNAFTVAPTVLFAKWKL
jgi:hypothetical protein